MKHRHEGIPVDAGYPVSYLGTEMSSGAKITRIVLKTGRWWIIDANSKLERGTLGVSFVTNTMHPDFAEMDSDSGGASELVVFVPYESIDFMVSRP